MKKIYFVITFLFLYTATIGQTVPIFPQDSSWKYLYDQFDLGMTWRTTTFDDSAWLVGSGEFGYGDGDEITLVDSDTNGTDKHRTIYFRKTFTLTNPTAYSWYNFSMLRDDGAVVYLNGKEIARSNMSNADSAYSNLAASEVKVGDEVTFYGFYIHADSFVAGDNVLAVEIHQAIVDDLDLSFNAKLDAVVPPSCTTPKTITANAITTTSASLSWDAVSGASSYNVRYRKAGTAIWTNTTATNTPLNITGLLPATNYEFAIQALCSATSDYSDLTYFTTLTAYCVTPSSLVASNVTASTATLSWAAVEGASSYTIQYRRISTTTWTTTTAATNTLSITGLLESSAYEFQVQAACLINSAFSASGNFTTLTSGTNFIIAANSAWKYLDNGTNQGTAWRANTFNDASWATNNTKFGYGEGDEATIVNYGPDANNKYVTTYFRRSFLISNPLAYTSVLFEVLRDDGVVVYLNGTEIFRNNLPTGTINYNTYAIVSVGGTDETTWYSVPIDASTLLTGNNVIAVEIHQQSLASSDLSFNGRLSATIPTACGNPDALVVTNIASSAAVLNWQVVSGATSYNVQYRLADTEAWTTTTATATSKPLTGLIPESHYQFKVQAVCSAIGDYSAIANFMTVALGCDLSTALNATPVTATTATLLWQAVADATMYDIRYRQVDTEEWNTEESNTNTKRITGLRPQTVYEFQVQVVCSFSSGYSNTYNFITTAPTCSTPSGVSVLSNSASMVIVNWNEVIDATSYNIQYQLAGTNSWVTVTSATNTKTITGLIAATQYEFRVQAVCSFNSNYSSPISFTTYAAGTDTFLAANATWKYLDNGTNQGTAWRTNTFNDTSWASGNAELGYGDGDEATIVSYGPNPNTKYLTTYFRKSFTVINPTAYTDITLGVIFDDGVVVYLNGNEVYRANMPAGTINYNTPAAIASSGAAESTWNMVTLNSSLFLTGTNVLTAEVHQISFDSSDLSFNARLTAPSSQPTAVVTRGAYLQKLNSNGVTIRWRTDIPSNSNVNYGVSVAYGNNTSDESLTTEHEVTLTGLISGAKYYYSIGTTTQILQGDLKNNFITAPTEGSTIPVRIWGIGDFGNGTNNQLNVRNAYTNYTGTTPTNLWLWLGDNAYTTGTDTEFQDRVFNQYTDQLKSMPVFPTPGNHDYNETGYQQESTLSTNYPYFSIFSLPQNAECGGVASGSPKYYSFNYANIHFISIDSYGTLNAPGSPMHTWLINDLAANTQRWTIVYMHYPPYTYGTHNSDTETTLIDMRTILVPLLESYHVDVLLAGHSHVNERSYMIKGHYDVANTFTEAMKVSPQNNNFVKTPPYDGTVYAVCGTSGQNPQVVNQPGFPMPAMYFNNNTNNCSLVIDVNGDNFSCKYLTSTGVIADEFTITKN
ncbi:fibronectin type III domain-containing protein [Flavobacterium sp.]|uniref:fibronectin type III domain-containing protein n=1 Tax=Flavobacterium sp. TaxID=239 RepID=UPI00286A2626|nr:fibronectin type III domain-containing protein [Flavobacterium sp.]